MTSRERVIAAISHQPPGRVPVDLNICLTAYKNLCAYTGFKVGSWPSPSLAMEVIPDPELLQRIGVDMISVKYPSSGSGQIKESVTDSWGVTFKLVSQSSGEYHEAVTHPLKNATLQDLDDYPWPSGYPSDEKLKALSEEASRLYHNTELALVGRFGGPIMEIAGNLLGLEEWYMRLMMDPGFIAKLLEIISVICTSHDLHALDACGQYLQIMKVSGEDFGMQTAPLYSRDIFNDLLMPPLKKRWKAVRERLAGINPQMKVMLHSCGSIKEFIPDLIEAGIDILDPVQPQAKDMDPGSLKEFSASLVFHGGIDVQQLLPNGTVEQVREGTRACLDGFQAEMGGFIVAPSHTVQADVPSENIIAMLETVNNYTAV